MKTHILLILFLSVCASVCAQVEIIRDLQSDTRRNIVTSNATLLELKKNGSFEVYMEYVQTFGASPAHRWFLGFDITTLTRDEMQAGMKLLIKCDDGYIIECRLVSEINEEDFVSRVIMGQTFYHIYPRYELTEEAIDYIAAHKIVKMRVEAPWNRWGRFDFPQPDSKPWSPSETITSLCIAIKTRLRTVPDNSIYHDF